AIEALLFIEKIYSNMRIWMAAAYCMKQALELFEMCDDEQKRQLNEDLFKRLLNGGNHITLFQRATESFVRAGTYYQQNQQLDVLMTNAQYYFIVCRFGQNVQHLNGFLSALLE